VRRGAGVIVIGALAVITAAQVGAEITNSVADLKNAAGGEQREGFGRGLLEKTKIVTQKRCNILVFNMNNDYNVDLVGYMFFEKIEFYGIPFWIFTFESGIFINNGNGGWSNLSFWGETVKTGDSGKIVNFKHRDCPIAK